MLHYFVCFQMHNKRLQLKSYLSENYLFLKNYVISEGSVSHNVLYYIISSLMIVNKEVFMLTIILSSNQ